MEALHASNPLHEGAYSLHENGDTSNDEAIALALAAEEPADQQAAAAQATANSQAAKLDQELALQAHDDEVTTLCRELSGVLSVAPQLLEQQPLERRRSESFLQRLADAQGVKLVPHINPTFSVEAPPPEARQRLQARLDLYGLTERKVKGDGNCQFRALSDQLYRTPRLHAFVRECTVAQLRQHRGRYEKYVPGEFEQYCRAMARHGEWGDHVTLKAGADYFGLRIYVLTSYPEGCFIEIEPEHKQSSRILYLSFWAEVHYNSVYMADDPPAPLPNEKLFGSRRLYSLLFREVPQ